MVSARTQAKQLVMTALERSSLTIDEYAEKVIAFAETGDQVARRAAVRQRVDVLRDAWGPQLKASLKNWTVPEVYKQVVGDEEDHLDLMDNPAKRVWTELGVLYTSPPRRTTKSGKDNGDRYNDLIKDTDPPFPVYWQMVEELLQACNEVLIWPDVVTDMDGNKTKYNRYATGDTLTLVTTDKDTLECILIHDERKDPLTNETRKIYKLWTAKWHAVYESGVDKQGQTIIRRVGQVPEARTPEEEEDDGYSNPYGGWVHYLIRRRPWQDTIFDSTSGADLMDGTIRGGEARQFFRYNQKMHGYKMLAATGHIDEQAIEQQIMGAAHLLRIPGADVSTQVLDWQINMKDAQSVLEDDELRLAASRGIGPERYKRKSYNTGVGARQAERPLAELRTKMAPIMIAAENAYFKAAASVWSAHGVDGVHDPDDEMIIDYAPLAYQEDPKQQLEIEKSEVALGLESPVTLLQRRRPELSREQAKEAIQKTMDEIAWFNDMKVQHNVPSDPSNESASAEVNGAMGPVVRDGVTPPGSPPGQAEAQAEE